MPYVAGNGASIKYKNVTYMYVFYSAHFIIIIAIYYKYYALSMIKL